jgi:hypothetical protein
MSDQDRGPSEFLNRAEEASPGIAREFIDFLRFNKKWWLIPIVVMLLLIGLLSLLSTTALAPFIYPLF